MKKNKSKTRRFIETLTAQDLIALVVLIGGFTLLALGIDGTVGLIVTSVVVYYFGRTMEDRTS